jgi:hypothetical protein
VSQLCQWAEGNLPRTCCSCLGDDLRYLLDIECAIGFDEERMVLPRSEELLEGRAYLRECHVLLSDPIGRVASGCTG